MQVEEEAEKQYKIVKLDRQELNPTLEKFELHSSKTRMISAPHTISICGSAFFAINRRCLVYGSVLENPPSGSQIHECLHQIQDMPHHSNWLKTYRVLRKFLKKLNLTKIYNFEIINPLDCNGQFSFPTVLFALYMFIGIQENDYYSVKPLKRIFAELVTEFKLTIEGHNDIIETIFNGSQQWVHLLTHLNPNKRTARIGNFAEKYDMVFIRTNLHPADFTPRLHGSMLKSYTLQTQFQTKAGGKDDIPGSMRSHTDIRLNTRSYYSLEEEMECFAAMESLYEKDPELVPGYESQQGGILVLLRKGNFFDDEILQTIAMSIATASNRPVASITFQLFETSVGISGLSLSDARGLPLEKKVVMEIETISPARKCNDMNEAKTEEESKEVVADQADETFDEEE